MGTLEINSSEPRSNLLVMPKRRFGATHTVLIFALVFAVWHILTNIYLTEPGLW